MSEKESKELLLLFDSIHGVLAAEQAFKACGLWHDIVPVPRDLSSDCGMAVLFRAGDSEAAGAILAGLNIKARGLHEPAPGGHRDVSGRFPDFFQRR